MQSVKILDEVGLLIGGTKQRLNVNAVFADKATDAFGRLRTSRPFTDLSLKQLFDSNPLFYNTLEVSGSGTSATYNTNQSSTTLAVSDATAGDRVFQSKIRGTYQPGKSMLVLATAVLDIAPNGVTKSVGYFDEKNGLFFQLKDGVAYVVVRSYTSGAQADIAIPQSSWNLNKLDGTGEDRVNIDFTKSQIFVIDFEWLGVGRVRMGVNIDGITYYCHEFLNANHLITVYMSTSNLPIRYQIENSGVGPAASMDAICAVIISEGGQEDVSFSTQVSRDSTPVTLANQGIFTPVISIRLNSSRIGTRLVPILSEVFCTTNTNFAWKLLLNPTIAGVDTASWVAVPNTAVEYDISRTALNAVTGGHRIAGGYGSSTAQSKQQIISDIKTFLTLGSNIDGSVDEFIVAAANIDANGGTAYGSMTLGEYS